MFAGEPWAFEEAEVGAPEAAAIPPFSQVDFREVEPGDGGVDVVVEVPVVIEENPIEEGERFEVEGAEADVTIRLEVVDVLH